MPSAASPQQPLLEQLRSRRCQKKEICRILQTALAAHMGANQLLPVWVFGSRATGRARLLSNLDLLIAQPHNLTWRKRADLADAFEASNLPFRVAAVEISSLGQAMVPRVIVEWLVLL